MINKVQKVQKVHDFIGKHAPSIPLAFSAICMVQGDMDGAIYGVLLAIFCVLIKKE